MAGQEEEQEQQDQEQKPDEKDKKRKTVRTGGPFKRPDDVQVQKGGGR